MAHAKKFGSYINSIDWDEAIRIDQLDQQIACRLMAITITWKTRKNPRVSSLAITIIWLQSNVFGYGTVHRDTKKAVGHVAVSVQFP